MNIFDTQNLTDLDKNVQEDIKGRKRSRPVSEAVQHIIDLFELKKEGQLSAEEIVVGLIRRFKMTKEKKLVRVILYRLAKKGIIERVGPSLFKIKKENQSEHKAANAPSGHREIKAGVYVR